MEKNYSQIYRDSIFQLVASINIKHDQTAQAINNGLMVLYGESIVTKTDPTTWKYYLNVSGEYHSTDTKMHVTSMDTLEVIEFNKANLEIHRATARGYGFGTNPYKELVNKYPSQELLIRGILYPCELSTAVTCEDGTILSYPEELVEEYEYSFINNLQTWIYGFLQRWDNSAYNLSDELYHPSLLGVLYACMIGQVYCLRKEACRTNEVHSYHLRNYLASHGQLDQYLPYLTREQALWLYRNINYIERHAGHQDTFEWLIENLFTKRKMPLAAFEMRHNLEAIPDDRLSPLVVFYKRDLNEIPSAAVRDTYAFSEIYDKEDPLARDNPVYRDDFEKKTANRMENSLFNNLKIKLLESSMIDSQGSEKFLLDEIRFYQWLYMANDGRYRAVIPFTSPNSGEQVYLRSIDAFTLYVYLYCELQSIHLTTLPLVTAKRVLKYPRVTLTELMEVSTPRVSDSFGLRMLQLLPSAIEIISIDLFSEFCVDVWRAANNQWKEVCREEGIHARGIKNTIMNRCWIDQRIQLGQEGQTYANFFAENNLDVGTYTIDEIQIAHDALLESALGVRKDDETSLVGIQKAMTEILTQLSSYSIQVSRDINTSAIRDVGQTALRIDDMQTQQFAYRGVDSASRVRSFKNIDKLHRFDDMGSANVPLVFDAKGRGTGNVPIGMNVATVVPSQKNTVITETGSNFFPILDPLPSGYEDMVNFSGLAHLLSLTEEQRKKLPINVI